MGIAIRDISKGKKLPPNIISPDCKAITKEAAYNSIGLDVSDFATLSQLQRFCRMICHHNMIPDPSPDSMDEFINLLSRIKKELG